MNTICTGLDYGRSRRESIVRGCDLRVLIKWTQLGGSVEGLDHYVRALSHLSFPNRSVEGFDSMIRDKNTEPLSAGYANKEVVVVFQGGFEPPSARFSLSQSSLLMLNLFHSFTTKIQFGNGGYNPTGFTKLR